MSFNQPFEVRIPKRGKIAQRIAVMGYIFGLIREIDPRLRYTFDTFTLIGLLWTLKKGSSLVFTILKGIRVHLFSKLWEIDLKKKYGEWVVITGATDGIGLEYAREFARRDHSLILIGRNSNKLNLVKNELAEIIDKNRVVTIVLDFEFAKPQDYKIIKEKIDSLNSSISILINNAGVMYKSPNRLLDQNQKEDWAQVTVNCLATVLVTRECLPYMVRNKRGLVINISSAASYRPLSLMGVYSASKKFIDYFSQTLRTEYNKYNIDVQLISPNYISTKMTKWSNVLQSRNWIYPNADVFVKSAVNTIGRTNETTGYWSHGLQSFIIDWLTPEWFYDLSSWYLLKAVDTSKSE